MILKNIPEKYAIYFSSAFSIGNIIEVAHEKGFLKVKLAFDGHKNPIILSHSCKDEFSGCIINTQNRVALLIDGELADEDWQLGSLDLEGKSVNGEIEISDKIPEIKEDFEDITDIKNFRPKGENTNIGDCMPFSGSDGLYHLFYLYDRRGHASKYGLGAHQWAHASTSDLKIWKQHPMAVTIDEQYEGSICTGSILENEGTFYAFFAVRMSDGTPARLTYAISENNEKYVKTDEFITLTHPYEPVSARDPKVFKGKDGLFHMLVTTTYIPSGKGCLAYLVSDDLKNWQQREPIYIDDSDSQPECADYFFFNGYYYLVFSVHGVGRYLYSKSPLDGWQKPSVNIVGGNGFYVPKAAFFGDRLIFAGSRHTPKFGFGGLIELWEAKSKENGELDFFVL